VTSDEVRGAGAACQRAFAFLVTEFGYRQDRLVFRSSGFELRYVGPGLGVLVEWYPRDPLTVWLVRLVDGDFPARGVTIRHDTELHHFDLGDVEAISGRPREAEGLELYELPGEANANLLAESLRTSGADFLRGDLTRLPLLDRRVKDRARALTIERYGAEYARELGW